MTTAIYWFRNDLRLTDNPALALACRNADLLLPVYCDDPALDVMTAYGFVRRGEHRRRFLAATLDDLSRQLGARCSRLQRLAGAPADVLPALARGIGATTIYCEAIPAPEEEADLAALRAAGLTVRTVWQSSLLDPAELPFATARLPDVFTAFRQAVERADVHPHQPLPPPEAIPPAPPAAPLQPQDAGDGTTRPDASSEADPRSSFPFHLPAFAGGETAALAHLSQYFARKLAQTYKDTRNGLTGTDYSSKFSPWLALGALSPRTAFAALKEAEAAHGANDSTYWLWFELLWRDYFRFLHLQHGRRLYRERGLAKTSTPQHNPQGFTRWCQGRTGEAIVDAGMRELAATGYLSNRLRQIVASYLIHDLGADWRAGAAWFESQLIDYDVCSNQGNWLYLAGRGTDPRSGRRFNPQKQARDYDPTGHYRTLWSHA